MIIMAYNNYGQWCVFRRGVETAGGHPYCNALVSVYAADFVKRTVLVSVISEVKEIKMNRINDIPFLTV